MFSYIMDVKDNEMRIGPAIRYLATSNRRDVFLAALWTKTVYVWSFNKIGKIAEFDTIFDPGGIRLAIASSKDLFVAGAYFRYGVACYHLFTGEKLWHRKDIHRVQKIKISPNDKEVFCGFDDKPGQLLDLATGVTIEKLRGVRDIEYDIYESCYVYDYVTKPLQVFNSAGHEVMKINKQTFAVVDLVFGPMHIALSEAGGRVRLISRKDPDKTVRYKPPDGQHVIRLAYSPTKGGVGWQ